MIEQFSRLSVQGRCFPVTTSFCFFSKSDERLSLIYGANGSGKSTLSRAFNVLSSPVESDISVTAADINGNPLLFPTLPPIAVFNEDYIDANVKIDDDGLGSIVLLGEHVELEAQIVASQQAIDSAAQELSAADSALAPFMQRSNISSPEYHWERIKNILKGTSQWAKTDSEIKGNRQNSAVTDAVVQEICSLAVAETLEELRAEFEKKQQLLERTASSNSAYNSPIRQISIDPHLEEKLISLLARKIAKPVLTERENLILQMVQDGHQPRIEEAQSYFSNNEATFCPYCFQQVTKEYKANLLKSILTVFNKDVDEHKAQLAGVKLADLSDAYAQYAELDEQLTKTISQLILEYNQILERYRTALKAKAESVYTPVTQAKMGLYEKIAEINAKLLVLEQKRTEFISAVRKRKTIENDLLLINKKIAALFCKDSYAVYKKQLKAKQSLLDSKGQKDLALKQAQAHMQSLLAQKKNLALAIDCINESLTFVFFSRDRLSIELRGEKYYLKSRGKDVKPKNVSQGERNIIALCYFFLQIASNKEISKRYKQEQLVVIDDPVSSFDFENKVGIISLLRREIKNIVFGNNNSKVIVLTHDLPTMFDIKKAYDEIGNAAKATALIAQASSTWFELATGAFQQCTKKRSEYVQLIEAVYQFAAGDDSLELSVGNQMRRVLEAFSTFCYRKSIEDVSCDSNVLAQLGQYADYFENRMYRLILHGESHYEEQVYNFHDSLDFYEFFSTDEKRETAKDILCFMYLLNKAHIKAYLPKADKHLQQWCADIHQNMTLQADKEPKNTAKKKVKLVDLPLSAGSGIIMFDDSEGGEDFEVSNANCDFALRIKGDSMEPQIPDGSIVLIHKQDTVEIGEIGAFFHNGNVYCKKRATQEGKTLLLSINSAYAPIEISEDDVSECYGKVIQVVAPS